MKRGENRKKTKQKLNHKRKKKGWNIKKEREEKKKQTNESAQNWAKTLKQRMLPSPTLLSGSPRTLDSITPPHQRGIIETQTYHKTQEHQFSQVMVFNPFVEMHDAIERGIQIMICAGTFRVQRTFPTTLIEGNPYSNIFKERWIGYLPMYEVTKKHQGCNISTCFQAFHSGWYPKFL